jgi:starch phosphorylase
MDILENLIVPEFYARDETGLPRGWLARIRASLSKLTPIYSSNRMLQEHVERLYIPAAAEFRRRAAGKGEEAAALCAWERRLLEAWPRLHIGESSVAREAETWRFSAPIYLGDARADDVRVELYAEPCGELPQIVAMERRAPIPGTPNNYIYSAVASAERPVEAYTIRVIPAHAGAQIPSELDLILWQR